MARDDDDDADSRRAKKRSRDEDDYSVEERPTRKRARDADDDDDDRPRKKRRPRDADDDEEDLDERPAKKKKKKPSRPLPGMLLALIIIAGLWGIICFLSSCFDTINNARSTISVFRGEAMLGGAVPLVPNKYGLLVDHLLLFVKMLISLAIIGGAVALFFRRAAGANVIICSPLGFAVVIVLQAIVTWITFGNFMGVLGPLLCGAVAVGIVFNLIIAYVFMWLANHDTVRKVLR